MYICVLPSSSFFFFFFFFHAWDLFCIDGFWRRGTRGGHVFDSDWMGGLVSGGNLFSFPHFSRQKKGLLILTSHFCSFSLLLFCHFPSACGVSDFLRCTFCLLSSQFPPDFKVCSLFKLYFLSDFLSFEFLFSLSLHFRLVSSVFMVGYSEIQRTSPSVAFLFARLGAF